MCKVGSKERRDMFNAMISFTGGNKYSSFAEYGKTNFEEMNLIFNWRLRCT